MFHLLPELMSLRTLIDGLIAFLAIGLTEAVIKPLAKAAIDRPLRRVLPNVYNRLDNEMPTLLQVVSLYSPIKAALRNVR
jgi:hypothetical protein